jgi:hypothetical protein
MNWIKERKEKRPSDTIQSDFINAVRKQQQKIIQNVRLQIVCVGVFYKIMNPPPPAAAESSTASAAVSSAASSATPPAVSSAASNERKESDRESTLKTLCDDKDDKIFMNCFMTSFYEEYNLFDRLDRAFYAKLDGIGIDDPFIKSMTTYLNAYWARVPIPERANTIVNLFIRSFESLATPIEDKSVEYKPRVEQLGPLIKITLPAGGTKKRKQKTMRRKYKFKRYGNSIRSRSTKKNK